MSFPSISLIRRRRHLASILRSLTIASSIGLVSQSAAISLASDPNCGCEVVSPSCGSEMADPACGCETVPPSCDSRAPSKVPCYRKRSLSFAEKFLKKLDQAGDEIEAKAAHSSVKSRMSAQPGCGCETSGPSCGSEFAMPVGISSCNCGPSIPSMVPTVTNAAPPIPHVHPLTRSNTGNRSESPFAAAQPTKRATPDAPMFPNKSQEAQARGKLSDQPKGTIPKQHPVHAPSPTQTSESSKALRPTPVDTPDVGDTTRSTPPAQIREPFQQKQTSAPSLPESSGLPSNTPSHQLNRTAPTPKLPQSDLNGLPQSQDEIPDVLVDPFKDDASWKSRRDRMNGVQLSAGEAKNRLRGELRLGNEAAEKGNQLPKLELAPPDISIREASEILVLPPTDNQQGAVVPSSFQEHLPVKVMSHALRSSLENDPEHPYVKRKAVPRK